jgi:hypothetical protein
MGLFDSIAKVITAPERAIVHAVEDVVKPKKKGKKQSSSAIPFSPFGHQTKSSGGGFHPFKDIIGAVETVVEAPVHLAEEIFNGGSGKGGTGSSITDFFKHSLKTLEHVLMPTEEIHMLENAVSKTFGINIPKKGIFHLTNGELQDISGVMKKAVKVSEFVGDGLVVIGGMTGQPEIAALGGGIIAASELAKVGDEYLDKYIKIHKVISDHLGRDSILPSKDNTPGKDQEGKDDSGGVILGKDGHGQAPHIPERPEMHKDIEEKNQELFPQSTFQEAVNLLDQLDLLYEQLEHPGNHHPQLSHPRPEQLNAHLEHTRLNEMMAI